MPLGPTGYGDSPYQCFSAFAGNPFLISLEALAKDGLLDPRELAASPVFPADRVDYGPVIEFHLAMLRSAFDTFRTKATAAQRAAHERFVAAQAGWLNDFSLFMAAKELNCYRMWSDWSTGKHAHDVPQSAEMDMHAAFHRFVQFVFFSQWFALRSYANKKNVKIIGDMPIFVAYDSADVWAHPELFHLDEKGQMTSVAGVPPDYFSKTGQLWGNPLYNWDVCAKEEFAWWISRFRWLFEVVDEVRIDHFRGFAACWSVPAGSKTAEKGKWIAAPGKELFTAVRTALGSLPLIAEDLGVITPEVEQLRDSFGFPGMKILQFAFDGKASNPFLPHNHRRTCVVYSGSHDNDTAKGWYRTAGDKMRDQVRRYLGRDGSDIAWDLIRAALASTARYAIVPLQDILDLDSEARMNFPGKPEGNWQWRFKEGMLTDFTAARLKDLATLYGRVPEPAEEEKAEKTGKKK